MGHSYVQSLGGLGFDVRDSIFELVLERTKEQLETLESTPERNLALALLADWNEEWTAFPPGCKEIKISAMVGPVSEWLARGIDLALLAFEPTSEAHAAATSLRDLVMKSGT